MPFTESLERLKPAAWASKRWSARSSRETTFPRSAIFCSSERSSGADFAVMCDDEWSFPPDALELLLETLAADPLRASSAHCTIRATVCARWRSTAGIRIAFRAAGFRPSAKRSPSRSMASDSDASRSAFPRSVSSRGRFFRHTSSSNPSAARSHLQRGLLFCGRVRESRISRASSSRRPLRTLRSSQRSNRTRGSRTGERYERTADLRSNRRSLSARTARGRERSGRRANVTFAPISTYIVSEPAT